MFKNHQISLFDFSWAWCDSKSTSFENHVPKQNKDFVNKQTVMTDKLHYLQRSVKWKCLEYKFRNYKQLCQKHSKYKLISFFPSLWNNLVGKWSFSGLSKPHTILSY